MGSGGFIPQFGAQLSCLSGDVGRMEYHRSHSVFILRMELTRRSPLSSSLVTVPSPLASAICHISTASADERYSTFYVLYPIGVGAEFWTTMSAVKEAYAWNPLYAMFMVGVFVGYIPGTPPLKKGY